jgi:carbonic anhydrase/acetyltransferase-like protein (isoleucine patch superfamily)
LIIDLDPQRRVRLGQDVLVAPGSFLIGDVQLGDRCSVWFNCSLRGDVMPIDIGRECNIQDGTVVHGTHRKFGVRLGNRVSVGHKVILHGCEVGDECLIGMGAVLMDGVTLAPRVFVAAGAVVTPGKKFPSGVLLKGSPARIERELRAEEIAFLSQSADNYLLYKSWYPVFHQPPARLSSTGEK